MVTKERTTKEKALEALKEVIDPDLGIDLVTLGFIYKVEVKSNKEVHVLMTLSSPMCPYAPQLIAGVKAALMKLGFENPKIEITFDPPWEPSDEVKMILGVS